MWEPAEHRQGLRAAAGLTPGPAQQRRQRSPRQKPSCPGISLQPQQAGKMWIHSLHFTLLPSRALVQIKSVVCAALGEDQSNLVEETPQNLLPDMSLSQINFTCSLQVQNSNSHLIA